MFNWENGQIIEQAYVVINNEKHYIVPAKYQGNTPMSAANLKKMQQELLKDTWLSSQKSRLDITEDTEKGAIVTIPVYYKVGANVLDVYLKRERLIICTGSDETTGSYLEVGTADSISNQIKLTSDWKLEVGDYLEFVVRGEWSNDTSN
ncbi:MAG: hypothetical protein J6K45_06555 [Clostridia bacterium]|nr:hypothetical protein [Clostridia bacterium]